MSYNQDFSKHYFKFIHIGKCGGTFLQRCLNISEYHDHNGFGLIPKITNPSLGGLAYNISDYFIIWIRNPINRFVSAFNYSYSVVTSDVSIFKTETEINKFNSIFPIAYKRKFKTGYAYCKPYDSHVKFFKSANQLAESLTSDNLIYKKKAHWLMNCPCEHIRNSIGWYLQNGDFIKKYIKKIVFVGCLENMGKDLIKLEKILNTKFNKNHWNRKNTSKLSKILSPLAIKNIKDFYKNTDYKALKVLFDYGFINKKIYNDYQVYNL